MIVNRDGRSAPRPGKYHPRSKAIKEERERGKAQAIKDYFVSLQNIACRLRSDLVKDKRIGFEVSLNRMPFLKLASARGP